MQQRGGVDELHRGGQLLVVGAGIAAQPRRGQRQHRAQALAARLDQMGRHFGDAGGMFAGHPRPDHAVHRGHILGQGLGQPVLRPFCLFRRAVHRHPPVPAPPGAALACKASARYVIAMRELLRTTDPTVIAFATALLEGEGIAAFALDVHMSVLDGSIGAFCRSRVMVADRDLFLARAILRDNGLEPMCT
jgi:hypothetical protein